MSKKIVELVCPYCGHRNMLEWGVDNTQPTLIQCGTWNASREFRGCFGRFVATVEWVPTVTIRQVEGEDRDQRKVAPRQSNA